LPDNIGRSVQRLLDPFAHRQGVEHGRKTHGLNLTKRTRRAIAFQIGSTSPVGRRACEWLGRSLAPPRLRRYDGRQFSLAIIDFRRYVRRDDPGDR
jgi:hypothetical protein